MGSMVPALSRGLDILELFLSGDQELGAPDVVARLGLPRTTAYELLQTLAARGYLEPVAGSRGTFRLGLRTFELGTAYGEGIDLVREAGKAVLRVTDLTGETSHAAVLSDTDVFYVARAESGHAVKTVSAVGRRLPAHATGVGKALLGTLSEDEVRARLGGDRLPILTKRTLASLDALEAELRRIRASGLAWDFCESNEDVCCVAVVVYDRNGPAAAMSVSVPIVRWSPLTATQYARVVREQAWLLSSRLGASSARREPDFDHAIAISPPVTGDLPA
ncbi:MAG TPA: IclR family transcriptional regulator [Streptosporangiaceae bacterium]|nr:IclR family transcriptional regulator [Streptosporangiaceae bacterium]